MNITCSACGMCFDDKTAKGGALGAFLAHRIAAHGDDYLRPDPPPGVVESRPIPQAKPCIDCRTTYGARMEEERLPWRSAQGRCVECYRIWLDRRMNRR